MVKIMRLIDADALLELYEFPPDYAEVLSVPIPVLVQNIRDMPTLDYAPVVHARWIPQDDTFTKFQCGSCKAKNYEGRERHCPNCGAKMDGVKKDENENC